MKIILVFFVPLIISGENKELETIREAIRKKNAKWVAGETDVSRLSYEERKRLCGVKFAPTISKKRELSPPRHKILMLPSQFDWRNHNGYNWMTPIKTQGDCGSCWAFSVAGVLESIIKIYTNRPNLSINLSEQYLISCGPGSCDGGDPGAACDFIKDSCIVDEDCFPYQANDEIPCEERCDDWLWRRRKIIDWGIVPVSIDSIKKELLNGPLSVSMLVYTDFYYYRGGVYEHTWGDYEGGHAIIMVGWNDNDSCWICKNSWGTGWGEKGWFKIKWGECYIENYCIWMIPSDNRLPEITYISNTIEELYGDGDGVPNPNETIGMQIALYNEASWSFANNVRGTLFSADTLINIIDSIGSFYNIAPGETVINTIDKFGFISPWTGKFPFKLHITANDGAYFRIFNFDMEISLNQVHWPITCGVVESSPAIIDIDNDGIKEIIFGCDDGKLYVKNIDGTNNSGFPFSTEGKIISSPAIGDVDADGNLDIVVGSYDSNIYIIKNDGSLMKKIPTGGSISATPVLSDLDNDNDLEIIIGSFDKKLYVLNHDGSNYANFPYFVGAIIYGGAAVGDINRDGLKDIIFGAINNKVYAISANGNLLPGWPFTAGGRITGEPSIAYINGIKIVIGSWDKKLYILNPDGTKFATFSTDGPIKCSPSFVDLDMDGDLEIVFGSFDGRLYACHHNGNSVNGWPITTGGYIQSSACFSDIDNDGIPEIIVGSGDNYIYGYRTNGSLVQMFPIYTKGEIISSPAIGDLDNDGDFEIVFGNDIGMQVIDFKTRAGSNNFWNMHRLNYHRTGNYNDVFPYGSDEKEPLSFILYPIYPNPCASIIKIKYALPKKSKINLGVYDLSGRLVKNLIDKEEEPGIHSINWEPKNLSSGIYFIIFKTDDLTINKKITLIRSD